MQNNEFCYKYDSKNKIRTAIKLQPDLMNDGFLPKPDDTLYEDPAAVELGEHETLVILNEQWKKAYWYVDTKLYHKTEKTEITITEIGKTPADYPDYTETVIPDMQYAYYYDYSETQWVFNLARYKADACQRVTNICVSKNYAMFPQYKRDNVYSGSPVSDNYPAYLKGEAGKLSIAKLNSIYQQISVAAQAAINSSTVTTISEITAIIDGMVFPTEEEILVQIQK